MSLPRLITGLSDIDPTHDALICDVWGVVHDGHAVYPAAAAALARFRRERGPVVLLTNAPRLPAEVVAQFQDFRVPPDCYDTIVTSGGAARDHVAALAAKGTLPLYYIGPERDLPVLEGLDVVRTGLDAAKVALCVGLRDDLVETTADYADELAAIRARGLTFLCANPDLVVHRGARLVFCAGALARDYEALGGQVVYFGKPHLPVYEAALKAAAAIAQAAGRPAPRRPLAIGDGLLTDIRGANAAGLDVLFIANGVHGEDTEPYTAEHLADLFARYGAAAGTATRTLQW